jgi:hypothetical protein
MKSKISIAVIVMIVAVGVGCKKASTPQPVNPKPAPIVTNSTYWISYVDTTMRTWGIYAANSTVVGLNPQTGLPYPNTAYSEQYNNKFGYANFNIELPVDSSSLVKIVKNKRQIITNFDPQQSAFQVSGGISLSSSNSITGTDSFVSETDTLTYYSRITSLTYIGRAYDSFYQRSDAVYILQGDFNVLVNNDLSNTKRVWSNGKYKFTVNVTTN